MSLRANMIFAFIGVVAVSLLYFKIYRLNSLNKELKAELQSQKATLYICEQSIQNANAKIKQMELKATKFSEPKVITKIKYLEPKDDSCEERLRAYEGLFELGSKR